MKSFEGCLVHIETTLGCKLLDWQKEVLHYIYNGEHPIVYCGRGGGRIMLNRAAKLLKELMDKES
jgi:hypothetical protein